MRIRAFIPLAAVAAVALAAAALPSCTSDIAGCDVIFIQTLPQDSLSLAVGDSARVLAAANSSCPEKIGHAVVFSSTDPSIIAVRQVDDTTGMVRGIAVGFAGAKATARDRDKVFGSIPVFVHAR